MHVDLSLATGDGFRDLRITASPGTALSDLLPAVAAAAGLDPGRRLWAGERPVGDGRFDDGRLQTGALLDVRPRAPAVAARGLLTLQVVGGPSAGQLRTLRRGRLVLGRDATCDVVLADLDVSRRHAEITVDGAVTVRDLGSTNGTLLDGVAIRGPVELRPGAQLRLGDSLVVVAGTDEAPAGTRPGPDGTRHVLRPPRPPEQLDETVIELPVRDGSARPRGPSWIAGLLPAAAGVGLAWYAGSPQFLLFALLSLVMLLSTSLGDRLHWRRSRRREAARFRRELSGARARIAEGLLREIDRRRRVAPDPATVLRIAGLPGERLWSRSGTDGLRLRLGSGELPSALLARTGNRSEPAGRVSDVPVEIDLGAGPVGVAGPDQLVDPLASWLIAQLAVHHSPAHVELAFLLDPQRAGAWSWARWLPHLHGRVARTSDEWPVLLDALRDAVEQRRTRALGGGGSPGSWLVIVADRAAELADRPAWSALLATAATDGAALRVAVVCVETAPARLPSACRTVAVAAGETGTRWQVRDRDGALDVVGDGVSPEWCEQVSRALAPLIDGSSADSALPASCGLLPALELAAPSAEAVAARWRRAGAGAVTVLGAGTSGPLTVDLAADGPHALVAGTTGAGKSELLQALVAGLAANHPPDALTLLLIDYKGGAAFADCARLPHTAGLVTDLDPYLTERALRSLDAELRRRERLLAEVGAADLLGYRAARRETPLPRLVIVVDEFATLAEELPDFVRGLVGVAQRGRSLGVHLVLATQRPGRAVSPEIRANTALRICLRVTDPAESSDVIGTPEAALLDRTAPGRGYLRSGGGLTAFQAAHASGRSPIDPERIEVTPLGPWRRPVHTSAGDAEATDLARLVAAINEAATRTGAAAADPIWQPPLPERLHSGELGSPERSGVVRLARVDRPEQLATEPLELDVTRGDSLLVAGAARSGRTQALATVGLAAAAQLSPAELTIHLVDPGGTLRPLLAPLPHLATSLGPESAALAVRLLSLLARGRAGRPDRDLLLVDGWDRLLAALPDADAATCGDLLAQLLRGGPQSGPAVVLSGDRSALMPRISSGFGQRVLLRQADRGDFGLAGVPARAVPPAFVPGRGLRAEDGAVLQVALAPDPAEVVARRWSGVQAARDRVTLCPLPDRVRVAELRPSPRRIVLGVGGDRCEPLTLDPFAGARRILVAGPPRSGRSTALVTLLRQASRLGVRPLVAAPPRSPLAAAAAELRLPVIGPDAPDPGPPPATTGLLLVDDCEAFADRPAGDGLTSWLRGADDTDGAGLAAIVSGRSDELATAYRGVGSEARRSHCGVLLHPGPVDGELLGVRLPRRFDAGPPGRGVIIGDPAWGPPFADGEPVPVQVAAP